MWAVERILNSRRRKGEFQYFIKWQGFDNSYNSWEPLYHVVHANTSIKEYEKAHPGKAKPSKEERQEALTA